MTPVPAVDRAPGIDDYDDYRLRRSAGDLYTRALIGPPFYMVGAAAIWAVGHLPDRFVMLLLFAILAFAGLWLARWRNTLPAESAPIEAFKRWKHRQWLLINAGYLVWSVVILTLGFIEREATLPFIVGLVSSVAFTSAASATFNTDRKDQQRMLIYLLIPGLIGLAAPVSLRAVAFCYVAYWFFAFASARNFCREYEARMRVEFDLRRSRADLETLVRTDALTGLWNRREYESVFDWAWQQRRRDKQPLALLVIDLDHFKRVNDEHGHLAGDECLKHVAHLLRASFRRTNDFVARIGGEEFVVVLPGYGRAEGFKLGEAFRLLLADSPCKIDGASYTLTASIGVGEVDTTHDANPDATFSRVDAACYRAKDAGRNRVEMA